MPTKIQSADSNNLNDPHHCSKQGSLYGWKNWDLWLGSWILLCSDRLLAVLNRLRQRGQWWSLRSGFSWTACSCFLRFTCTLGWVPVYLIKFIVALAWVNFWSVWIRWCWTYSSNENSFFGVLATIWPFSFMLYTKDICKKIKTNKSYFEFFSRALQQRDQIRFFSPSNILNGNIQ